MDDTELLKRSLADVWWYEPGAALWRAVEANLVASQPLDRPVLDAGCGDGGFAFIIGDHTKMDVGVDISHIQLARAEHRGAHSQLRLLNLADMGELPDEYFGSAIANCVLEHIPDVEKALAELARVIRPGGKLVLTVPSEDFVRHTLLGRLLLTLHLRGLYARYDRRVADRYSHHHVCDLGRWTEMLRRSGFQVARWRFYMRPRAAAVWDCLEHLIRLGIGRYTIGAIVWHLKRSRVAIMHATTSFLKPYYENEREEELGVSGAALFIVAVRNDSVSGM